LRPRQWSKNLLVYVAPAAAGVLHIWHEALRATGAFGLFCALASGVYLFNDAIDAEADRRHPTKQHRPVAAGAVPVPVAFACGIGLMVAGVVVALVVYGGDLAIVLGAYAVVTIAYSLRLKREPVIELAAVAAGFVLRAVAGGVATNVPLSSWFLVVTSFGALFVVTGKRAAEHRHLGEVRGLHRAALEQYSDSFLASVLTVTATVTVTAYCLWAFDKNTGLLHHAHHAVWIQLTVVPVVLAVLYVLRLLDAGQGGAPEDLALHDHFLQVMALTWVGLLAVGLYA
jgi:decaprenyl-phosphate phosphoribosyltransferase